MYSQETISGVFPHKSETTSKNGMLTDPELMFNSRAHRSANAKSTKEIRYVREASI